MNEANTGGLRYGDRVTIVRDRVNGGHFAGLRGELVDRSKAPDGRRLCVVESANGMVWAEESDLEITRNR